MRVAIAGLGFGRSVHLPALRSLPGVEVVALLGRQTDATAAAAAEEGVPCAVTTAEALVELGVDAVTVAVPPAAAPATIGPLLAAGIPVLAEKPLALDVGAARDLVAAAGTATTAVDFEMRELRTFTALHDLVAGGDLGGIRSIDVAWSARSWAQLDQRWSWKLDAAAGGGVLPLLGTHVFDLLEWIAGPVEIAGVVAAPPVAAAFAPSGSTPALDTVAFSAEARGVPITVNLTNAATTGSHRWTVVGERATAEATNEGPDWMAGFSLRLQGPAGSRLVADEEPGDGDGRMAPFRSLAARFLDAARRGAPCTPSFAEGLRAQELLAAVADAAA